MRKTKPAILEAVRETARGLHKASVMGQVTLREFDLENVPPVAPLWPAQNQAHSGEFEGQSGCVRADAEHERFDRAEKGDWPEAADGDHPQALAPGAEAWARCGDLTSSRLSGPP